MASNKASQAHTHDLTRPAKAAAEGGTVCKKSRQSHRIQPMGSQTSTPTPKLILRVALGKRESFVGAKRNRLAVYLFVSFFSNWVFNSHCVQSRRFCSKRIFLLVNATQ